jgi:hypothetical protein
MDANSGALRLANLSLTDHRPYLEQYQAQGYDVEPDPGGIILSVGLGPEEICRQAVDAVRRVVAEGYDGAIVGGRPDAVCYMRDALVAFGLRCYAADTARMLDREGYFVAMPVGLVEILPAVGAADERDSGYTAGQMVQ